MTVEDDSQAAVPSSAITAHLRLPTQTPSNIRNISYQENQPWTHLRLLSLPVSEDSENHICIVGILQNKWPNLFRKSRAHEGKRRWSLAIYLFMRQSLTESGAHIPGELMYLATMPVSQWAPRILLGLPWLPHTATPRVYMGAGDPNSESHACMTGTLPTGPSLESPSQWHLMWSSAGQWALNFRIKGPLNTPSLFPSSHLGCRCDS